MPPRRAPDEGLLAASKVPYGFVLEALADLDPVVRPMFGAYAVYVGERMVLVLRRKRDDDDGVWVSTEREHHASLRPLLPSMRSVSVLGAGLTATQNLPESGDDFEAEALRACAMIRAGDPRVGRVPKKKRAAKGR